MVETLQLYGILARKVKELVSWVRRQTSVLVMLSGGLDSGVLAYLCSLALPKSTYTVTVSSTNVPRKSVSEAAGIAGFLNITHKVIKLDLLGSGRLANNPRDRCYICKKEIVKAVKEYARDIGVKIILDGTNTDDLKGWRPGLRALEEEGVLSPYVIFGFSKDDIRVVAAAAKLYFKDKLSDSCLFTRFPYGVEVKPSDLRRVEEAERLLEDVLKVRRVRVRDYGFYCRIELDPADFKFTSDRGIVSFVVGEMKKLGYRRVTLDLEGYRQGSMDS